MKLHLFPHSSSSHPRPLSIECEISRATLGIGIEFTIHGMLDRLEIPEPGEPERRDGLWRHTCFEAFLRPAGGTTYHEFNMAPSRAWAVYRFDDYREGFSQSLVEPAMAIHVESGVRLMKQFALLDFGDDPPLQGPLEVGLSAVVEATDGSKSYWALAHPDGPPDFHNPACFIATLPPIAQS